MSTLLFSFTQDTTASATQVTIATGATSATVTITAVDDTVDDDDETVVVDITNVTGAAENGEQQVTATIIDDDEPVVLPTVSLAVDPDTIADNTTAKETDRRPGGIANVLVNGEMVVEGGNYIKDKKAGQVVRFR